MSDKEPRRTDKSRSQDNSIGVDVSVQAGELMCWKDDAKVCKCEAPKRGVYCGRFPLPTD